MVSDESLVMERLNYLWYINYDEYNEYDYNPEWSTDTYVIRDKDGPITYKDSSMGKDAWISTEKQYDLVRMI